MTATHRLGSMGRIVIPKPMRDALGLVSGDEVAFRPIDGKALQIEPARGSRPLKGMFAGGALVEMLEAEHPAELGHERR